MEHQDVDQSVIAQLLEQVSRAVGRPVIDYDDLELERYLAHLLQQALRRVDLVVRGNDDRQCELIAHGELVLHALSKPYRLSLR